jgi:hypothetical protein
MAPVIHQAPLTAKPLNEQQTLEIVEPVNRGKMDDKKDEKKIDCSKKENEKAKECEKKK